MPDQFLRGGGVVNSSAVRYPGPLFSSVNRRR